MPWMALLAAGSSLGSSAIGAAQAQAQRDQALALQSSANDIIQRTGLPPDIASQIALQQYQNAGKLTPQMEQALSLGPSNVAGIKEDPGLKQAQMSALQSLQQRGQTGLSPEDRASLNQTRNTINTDAEGKRQQIMQNFAARGQGGSGSELAAALQSSSQAQNQASEQGDRLAGLSSQRALESMVASGQLGGQVRSQDFNIANTKAQAQDAINRFNQQNSQSVSNANTGISNNAQQYNLANSQRLSDLNTGVANQQNMAKASAQQSYWNNLLNYNQSKANALGGFANQLNTNANQTAQQYNNMGAGAAAGIGAYQNYSNQQDMTNAYNNRTAAMQQNNYQNDGVNSSLSSYDPNSNGMSGGFTDGGSGQSWG